MKELCLVTELWEEVSRLRIIRECEKEADYWNWMLHSLGQTRLADRMHDMEDSLSSLHFPECNDIRN